MRATRRGGATASSRPRRAWGRSGITKDGRRCGRGVALSHRASRASETSVLTGRTVARARVAARRRAGAPDGARRPRVVRLVPHPARCRRRVRARCADTHAGWLDDHRSRNRDCLTAPQQHLRQTAALHHGSLSPAQACAPRDVHNLFGVVFRSIPGRARGRPGPPRSPRARGGAGHGTGVRFPVPGAPRAREGGRFYCRTCVNKFDALPARARGADSGADAGHRRHPWPCAWRVGTGVAGAAAAPGSRAVGRRWAWRRAGRAPGDRRLITG